MNFIEQFQDLLQTQPRYNLKQVNAENCEYADTAVKSKNCYYSFGVFYCEDVYYARYSRKCTSCSDITLCANCEGCVSCTDCVDGYMLNYCQHCQNCSECLFCRDCTGCQNCFGCLGLYQKQYCMFNEQLTKEEYQKKLKSISLENNEHYKSVIEKVKEIQKKSTNLGIHQFRTEDCVGDNLSEAKGCYQCYDAFKMEDCLYNIECNGNKDSCDMTVCFEAERCYSCVQSPLNFNCNFLLHTDYCSDSEFCAYSKNLNHCFGCVYLSNKEYHILNKPYKKEEYEKKVAAIKKELIEQRKYNMSLYFISDYEQKRLENETDSVIQPMISTSNNL